MTRKAPPAFQGSTITAYTAPWGSPPRRAGSGSSSPAQQKQAAAIWFPCQCTTGKMEQVADLPSPTGQKQAALWFSCQGRIREAVGSGSSFSHLVEADDTDPPFRVVLAESGDWAEASSAVRLTEVVWRAISCPGGERSLYPRLALWGKTRWWQAVLAGICSPFLLWCPWGPTEPCLAPTMW